MLRLEKKVLLMKYPLRFELEGDLNKFLLNCHKFSDIILNSRRLYVPGSNLALTWALSEQSQKRW